MVWRVFDTKAAALDAEIQIATAQGLPNGNTRRWAVPRERSDGKWAFPSPDSTGEALSSASSGWSKPTAAELAQEEQDRIPLQELAQRKGILFGSCIRQRLFSLPDAAYGHLLARECGLILGEGQQKRDKIEATRGQFDWTEPDQVLTFAQNNNLKFKWHAAHFHTSNDKLTWVDGSHDYSAELWRWMEAIAARYASVIGDYDVWNEAIEVGDGNNFGLRDDNMFGTGDYRPIIIDAYQLARELHPNARLVYNDYLWPLTGGSYHGPRNTAILNLLTYLVENGAPIDAFGIQSHLIGQRYQTDWNVASWNTLLDAVEALGLEIDVTEFDIGDRFDGTEAERIQAVADETKFYMDTMLARRSVKRWILWHMSDAMGVLDSYNRPAPPHGQAQIPHAYDTKHHVKSVIRKAMADAFIAAPEREPA